ncbi:tripartite tricarboxylate transporter TctB family protein [Meiothermus cerbereus]|uniref:tripartite tricarboxylate transporter TctB family protein n=1 Tax=Meiothermus cerbereus TaxID=65552 RepID=UPI003EEE5524
MVNPARPFEMVVCLLALALGLAAWFPSNAFPRTAEGYLGPALFPKLLAVVLVLASLTLLYRNLRQAGLGPSFALLAWPNLLRIGGILLALLLAPWALGKLGLLGSAGLLVLLSCLLLGARWLEALLTALFMVGFVYLVFVQMLKVPL